MEEGTVGRPYPVDSERRLLYFTLFELASGHQGGSSLLAAPGGALVSPRAGNRRVLAEGIGLGFCP